MAHQSELIASDIDRYLREHERKDLLRFITCGSVDDGKSTLIGRLLHDSKMIFEDQLAAITRDSKSRGTTGDRVDLALLVDGLQSEREQGITIDVAYRFFSTDRRKFIIADTPGHEQYTRNMATGASTAALAVILIDARYGVQTQTRRHSFICDLLGIRRLVIAINKMDLVEFSQARFEEIKRDYLAFAENLDGPELSFIPMSALEGDNVVGRSVHTPWYYEDLEAKPLLELLETVDIERDKNFDDLRFPVQYVNRPNLDFRGYAGTLAAGVLRPGQQVRALPSQRVSTVERVVTFDGDLDAAYPGQAVTVTLADEIDVSRGDWLVGIDDQVAESDTFDADLVWMSEQPLVPGRQYDFKLATREASGQIGEILYGIDVNSLDHYATGQLALNDIARVQVALTQSLPLDRYRVSPGTGSFIVIDRLSNVTVGAGMIREAREPGEASREVDWQGFELELNALVRRYFPHWEAKDLSELLKR
ncbi:sulfate adenylyltransferase subunit CysN [Halotalea alkalilenta]|uniref:Sulfate adenylyltransferase subunit 1 n=1 Tax=Halotalea alkalilenta TaxID=376489 RepID=A0A172YDY5_9GAMM|nr:sulfate adenylyltransferase subunit CysN [Halotalea alkalilenta]ANF57312.1 sulfate adenylyltransferase subunit CysN [Halotalea alkalilenta]